MVDTAISMRFSPDQVKKNTGSVTGSTGSTGPSGEFWSSASTSDVAVGLKQRSNVFFGQKDLGFITI